MSNGVGFTAPKFAMLGVTSIITMAHAAHSCDTRESCKKEFGWAVACSSISAFICLAYLIVYTFVKGKQDFIPAGLPMQIFTAFMTLWWTAGAGVMTFDAPFRTPSNGYFGAWLSFFICALATYSLFPSLAEAKGHIAKAGNEQGAVLFAGLILLAQAAKDCDDHADCKKEMGWGVACGCLAFVVAAVLIFARQFLPEIGLKIAVVFQFLLWAAGWGVLTFRAPYTLVGNGYFALIIGFVLSMKAALTMFGFDQELAEVSRAIDEVVEEATPEDAKKEDKAEEGGASPY